MKPDEAVRNNKGLGVGWGGISGSLYGFSVAPTRIPSVASGFPKLASSHSIVPTGLLKAPTSLVVVPTSYSVVPTCPFGVPTGHSMIPTIVGDTNWLVGALE
jgi:hypothetical protein